LHRLATIFVGKIAIRIDQRGDPTEQGSKIRSDAKMVDTRQWASIQASTLQLAVSGRFALESMNA
jgi:hypothetical protein